MTNGYKKNRVFANYGTYAKATQPIEYVAIPTTDDLRASEIAANQQKLEAARLKGNLYQVDLCSAEIARLEASR